MHMSLPKLVIFCGAGFSTCANIPVMSQFASRLRSSGYLTPEEQADFDTIQLTCESMGGLIGVSARNLEQLSSFIAILNLTRPDFRFVGATKYATPQQALALITRCIRHLVRPDLNTNDVVAASHIFDSRKLVQMKLVTTNYDVLLELAGLTSGFPLTATESIMKSRVTLPEANSTPSNFPSLYSNGSTVPIDIFKLHGSVNWFNEPGETGRFRTLDHIGWAEIPNAKQNNLRTIKYSNVPDCCVIVPPTVLKPQAFKELEEQWQGASKAIREADHVWFIGYSFPESDSFMRYFLASALHDNPRIKQIAVIDPDQTVEARCRSILRSATLESVFRFVPFTWQQVNRQSLLQGSWNYVHEGGINDRIVQLRLERVMRGELPPG